MKLDYSKGMSLTSFINTMTSPIKVLLTKMIDPFSFFFIKKKNHKSEKGNRATIRTFDKPAA